MKTLLLISVAMLIVSSANAEQSTVDVEAMQWLSIIDGGGYEQSWDESASLFQASISKEDWTRALNGVRQPLGTIESRKIKTSKSRSSLPGAPDGEYTILTLKSRFENKQKATETLTMVKEASAWKAVGYFIK